MTVEDPLNLYWRSESVAKILRRHGVTATANPRKALAQRINQPYSTVCANLTPDWTGRVKTFAILTSICQTFRVPLASVVIEPKDHTA